MRHACVCTRLARRKRTLHATKLLSLSRRIPEQWLHRRQREPAHHELTPADFEAQLTAEPPSLLKLGGPTCTLNLNHECWFGCACFLNKRDCEAVHAQPCHAQLCNAPRMLYDTNPGVSALVKLSITPGLSCASCRSKLWAACCCKSVPVIAGRAASTKSLRPPNRNQNEG